MTRTSFVALICLGICIASTSGVDPSKAQHSGQDGGMDGAKLFPTDGIEWQSGPASVPKGAMIAVLEGDGSGMFISVLRPSSPKVRDDAM